MQTQFARERRGFSKNGAERTESLMPPKMDWNSYLIPYIKFNSKWAVTLNVKPKTITLFE